MGARLQLSRNGKIVGEYDIEKLRVMKDEGRIFPGDYLWMNGWAEWQKAIEYLETAPATEPVVSVEKPAPKKRRRRKKQLAEGESAEDAGEEESDESQAFPWGKALGLVAAFLVILNTCSTPETNRKSIPTTLAKARQEKQAREKAAQKASTTATNPSVSATKTPPARIDYSFKGFGYDGKKLFASSVLAYAAGAEDETDAELPEDSATFYYEGSPYAAIALSGVRKGDRFKVTISGDRFIKASKFEFIAKKDDAFVEVGPNTLFDYEALNKLRQSVPFNVTYTVQRGDEPPRTESETWIAHQINDCQISCANLYLNKKGEITAKPFDASFAFAGYVNENHPWIDNLLKDALATGLCRNFSGYQEGEEGVLRQVNAIWTALQKRGISYSSIANFTASGGNSYQHVRFIDESISSSQANCIDGSVVLASVLRKIGLNVSIILTPGHAYIAVLKDDDSEYLFAIETTMIGGFTLEKAIDYATESGPQAINKIYEKIDDEKHPAYQELNIRLARKIGINPIPYSR